MMNKAKVRNSNIELFRIFLMLMIVAHHYVIHGGVIDLYDYDNLTGNQIFLELWGFGGKIGINCFLLITGYFMCKLEFTWKKLLKLYLQIKFYSLLLPFAFLAFGLYEMPLSECLKTFFLIGNKFGRNFATSFLAMYMLVPFLNYLVNTIDRKSLLLLISLMLLFYTVSSTFFFNSQFDYIGWCVTVYLIGAFLRLYPLQMIGNVKKSVLIVVVSIAICFSSILLFTFVKNKFSVYIYILFDGPNKIMAIITAIALFGMFKSIDMGKIKWINYLARATFGIYLIHDDAVVRPWLWDNVVRVKDYLNSDCLWLHAICSCLAIYVVCGIIDLLRQVLLEKPLFDWLEKKYPSLSNGFSIRRSEQ